MDKKDLSGAGFYPHLAPKDTPLKEEVRGKVTINLKSQAEEFLGASGRMLSGSKSAYRNTYPDHTVYFNACIFNDRAEEIWFGDLDLELDKEKLKGLARAVGKIYVTPEQPYRFEGLDLKHLDERVQAYEKG